MAITFLKFPPPIALAGNQMTFRIAGDSAYVNGNLRNQYKIGIRPTDTDVITEMDIDVSHPALTDVLPVGWDQATTGVGEKDIQEIFVEPVFGNFTFPEPDTGLTFVHNIIKTYLVEAFERYNGAEHDNLNSATLRVMQGKLSNFRQGKLNYLNSSFYNMILEI